MGRKSFRLGRKLSISSAWKITSAAKGGSGFRWAQDSAVATMGKGTPRCGNSWGPSEVNHLGAWAGWLRKSRPGPERLGSPATRLAAGSSLPSDCLRVAHYGQGSMFGLANFATRCDAFCVLPREKPTSPTQLPQPLGAKHASQDPLNIRVMYYLTRHCVTFQKSAAYSA
jgi:hypothetical protein